MPTARNGAIRLHYQEAGHGTPLVFVHEFSGDLRSWEAQMRAFARRHRCIAFNARGYPPSGVPRRQADYAWEAAVDDIACVMDHAGARRAHVVGCSMGAYSAIQFGIRHRQRALSITSVGAGAGSDPTRRDAYLAATEAAAQRFLALGMPQAVRTAPPSPGRLPLARKDPRGFAEFMRVHASHSAIGLAGIQRGVQARRPPLHSLERALRSYRLPLLIVCGDEDDANLEPALFVKRVCPTAELCVVPGAGHTVNTEEPGFFNALLQGFLTRVDTGAWRARDPRSFGASLLSNRG